MLHAPRPGQRRDRRRDARDAVVERLRPTELQEELGRRDLRERETVPDRVHAVGRDEARQLEERRSAASRTRRDREGHIGEVGDTPLDRAVAEKLLRAQQSMLIMFGELKTTALPMSSTCR